MTVFFPAFNLHISFQNRLRDPFSTFAYVGPFVLKYYFYILLKICGLLHCVSYFNTVFPQGTHLVTKLLPLTTK